MHIDDGDWQMDGHSINGSARAVRSLYGVVKMRKRFKIIRKSINIAKGKVSPNKIENGER